MKGSEIYYKYKLYSGGFVFVCMAWYRQSYLMLLCRSYFTGTVPVNYYFTFTRIDIHGTMQNFVWK